MKLTNTATGSLAMPSASALAVEAQLRRARTELEEGLRASGDTRAEAYLAAYPAVAADAEAALELVYTEFVLREQLGKNPDPADWYARFPQWRGDLEQMFEVHRELKKEDSLRKSRAATVAFPPPPAADDAARRVGEFELLGEVGRGGMGVVYKAHQPSLGRVVAVKVILAGAHAGGRERERFRREAETAAKLDHPNVVRIFAVGEHDGRPYCAMEFVDGASLADLLDGRPWPVRQAAELVAAVAAAAQHAHENGVVHRDLKPANILLVGARKQGAAHPTKPDHTPAPHPSTGTHPVVKVVDFGLAKSLLDADRGPTRTGDLIGTPAYMSPEQASALADVGPAADVWGIGVTLYELLVGHPPFQGASSVETLQQVREAEPMPPRRLRPAVPRDLEVICLKCLRKDPKHRYPSAAALADDLNRYLGGEPIRARPVSAVEHVSHWCRRNPVVAGLSLTAVMLAVAAVALGAAAVVNLDTARRGADDLANQQRATATEQAELRLTEQRRAVKLQVNEAVRLLNDGDCAGGAVLLADAMSKDPDRENEEVYRVRLGTALGAMPTLRQAFRVPIHRDPSAPPRAVGGETLFPLEDRGPLTSDDGSTLLTQPAEPPGVLWNLHAGTSRPLPLTDADGVALVALSSNGAAVVGLKGDATLAWDTATGRPLTVPLPPGFGTLPWPFTRDGARRIGGGGRGEVRQVYAADGTRVGKPIAHDSAIMATAISADGLRVATASRTDGARVWDMLTGAAVSPLVAKGRSMFAVTLSPDGQTLFTSAVGLYQSWDVKTGQELGYQPVLVTNGFPPQAVPGHPWVSTGGWESGVRVWDNKLRTALSSPMPDTASLVSFTFRPNGDALAVFDRRLHARVWEPVGGAPLTPKLYAGEPLRGYFSADGTRLTTVTAGGGVRVWDAPPVVPPDVPVHPWLVFAAEWRPGGDEVVSVGDGGAILSHADGRVLRKFPHQGCRAMAVSGGKAGLVATLDEQGGVRVWEVATGRERDAAVRPPSPVRSIAFTPDGLLAAGGTDGVVRLWDTATGTATGPELAHDRGVQSLAVGPDGTRLLVNTAGGVSRLWDLSPGRAVRDIKLLPRVTPPLLSPDGRTVCVFTRTTAEVQSADDGTPLHTLELGRVARATYSPDGRYLAHPNLDQNTVTVWDVTTGRAVGRPLPYPPPKSQRTMPNTAFSRDGRFLALSNDSSLTVWEVAGGAQMTPPLPVRHAQDLKFDVTGRRLLVASVDKTVRVIELSPDTRPVEELAERAALLANRTLAADGGLVPLPPAEAERLWEKYRPRTAK